MIVEQCYRILLDSTAQAVRPGFIIDFEPQDRWRKSIIRHYRPAPRGICNARRYRRDCANQGPVRFSLARGLHHARPGIVLDARGYAEKPEDNLVPGVQLSDFEPDLSAGAGAELKESACPVSR